MTLGEKLIAAREARGWNPNQAARAARVGRTTLLQLEADVQELENIRLVTAVSIVDAYDNKVTLKDFLQGFPLRNKRRIVGRR